MHTHKAMYEMKSGRGGPHKGGSKGTASNLKVGTTSRLVLRQQLWGCGDCEEKVIIFEGHSWGSINASASIMQVSALVLRGSKFDLYPVDEVVRGPAAKVERSTELT